ncbi:MAG: ATP-binding cassette domain-containing protein [Acidobacteriaceae bacterium]
MPDISIRHRQGHFALEAEFSLTSRWTVLFGPSGAGKSTALRVIAGLIAPDAGYVALAGRTLLDTTAGVAVAPGRRSIGFVTQQPALFPHLTVRENAEFGIHRLAHEERRQRAMEMLRFFGAEALAERRTQGLSGGERQRVALARALAPAPDLLLLDEPLAALDDVSSQDILARLLRLETRVLYVSHDLAEIWPIPAEIVLIDRGRVTATGPLRQVLAPQRDRLLQQIS